MKVIDLLNKIANSEEVPKKIIYRDTEYIYYSSVGDYIPDLGEQLFTKLFSKERTGLFINDEVIEIIEEDKKIEKLEIIKNYSGDGGMLINRMATADYQIVQIANKINEIIDKINGVNKE